MRVLFVNKVQRGTCASSYKISTSYVLGRPVSLLPGWSYSLRLPPGAEHPYYHVVTARLQSKDSGMSKIRCHPGLLGLPSPALRRNCSPVDRKNPGIASRAVALGRTCTFPWKVVPKSTHMPDPAAHEILSLAPLARAEMSLSTSAVPRGLALSDRKPCRV